MSKARVYSYHWASGFRPGVSAEVAAQELQHVERDHGELTPHLVLDRARAESSPLHRCFEWDDSKAAERYRLAQAGHVIHRLRVVVKTGEPEQPAHVSLRAESAENESDRTYVPIIDVVSDQERRREFLAREVARISGYLDRTMAFPELDPIREALAEVEQSLAANEASQAA